MTIYIVWECYIRTDGGFRKIIRKIFDSFEKVETFRKTYTENNIQWLECEARTLE